LELNGMGIFGRVLDVGFLLPQMRADEHG
jgi:hypothetical protein